jgi:hypothetical protein
MIADPAFRDPAMRRFEDPGSGIRDPGFGDSGIRGFED